MPDTKPTILVTGGSGFIGGYVVEELLNVGFKVVIFDHQLNGDTLQERADVDHFFGDIRDQIAVTEAVSHADGVIHLAGVLGTQETIDDPRPAVLTNITGGINVLEAVTAYGVPLVNIAVGNHWENNPYSISKSTVERLAHMYDKERDTKVTTVRAMNAYGPGQSVAAPYGPSKVRKIMPSFIHRAINGDPIEIYGTGDQVMDMIYVGDLASILVEALLYTMEKGAYHHVIEAGTGEYTTVNHIAEAVAKESEKQGFGRPEIKHIALRPGESAAAVVVADKQSLADFYTALDPNVTFARLINLEAGVSNTFRSYMRHTPSEDD